MIIQCKYNVSSVLLPKQKYAFRSIAVFILLIAAMFPLAGLAQEEPEFDEISIFFNVPRIGGTDIPAVIRNEILYLPVSDVFDFLKIRNTTTPGFDSINGFFINQQDAYLIDRQNNRITYQDKVVTLNEGDLIRTETNLYLRSNYFGQIFGLQCSFNFRSLSVTLNTKIELPIIRELRQEQMRRNISQLTGEIKSDTTITRRYPLFHFGMADWSVISSQQINGMTDSRLTLTLGSILAGGETNVTLNLNNNLPFTEKEQYYYWHYVNNDNRALRQIIAGKISSGATASLYSPVAGIQFTNTPTTYRRSFGSYTLSDFTKPGWIVELYVNNVLVDFVKADASGFFTFQVPLVYGNSGVKLQFYGPWGEEQSKEQNISIPFNFLPVGEFEYKVSAGIVEDGSSSRYTRANMNYGISRRITVGGGLEYLSSVTSGSSMPFLTSSLRLASSLLISGDYTYGVRSRGILSYRTPSNVQLELNYTKYDKGQKAINYNYLEERKLAISVPLRGSNFAAFSRLTIDQIVLPGTRYTTAELLLSGMVAGINTNFTTYSLFADLTQPYTYSNLSFSFKLPGAIILTPQTQFEYNHSQLISMKCGAERHIFKRGFINLSYEKNFRSDFTNLELGLRFDLSFAQAGFSVRKSGNLTTLVQSASGSIMADSRTKYIGANNKVSVGKSGVTLLPFLDLNCNGIREADEPRAFGLKLQINGGHVELNEKDTTIRIFDLESYSNYLITLDGTNFDNIAWQIRKKTISVITDPNLFKFIEVPVAVVAEAAGTVFLKGSSGRKGQGRIIVNFFRSDSSLVARTLSETDGYFSYMGLAPGQYYARIDASQLKKLHMSVSPAFLEFTVAKGSDGDVVDGLEFEMKTTENLKLSGLIINSPSETKIRSALSDSMRGQKDAAEKPLKPALKVIPGDKDKTNSYPNSELIRKKTDILYFPNDTIYRIQLLALKTPLKDTYHFTQLLIKFPELRILESLEKDGLYHYGIGPFGNETEARNVMKKIKAAGWDSCFLVAYIAAKNGTPDKRLNPIK